MIDFIIKEHVDIKSKISKEELIERLGDKVDLELAEFMIDGQEKLEVTYHKNDNRYRFDHVDIRKIAFKYFKDKSNLEILKAGSHYANIDFDLRKNKFILFNGMDGIAYIINSDLTEKEKVDLIIAYKSFRKELRGETGFGLQMLDDDSDLVSLVYENGSALTLDNLSVALSRVEEYRFNNIIYMF